ncbi:MAG: hypothetical protein GXO74_09260 [Calditrichaeota bacterium]|nr:hypothetical protein [Calditrichota bacterium]
MTTNAFSTIIYLRYQLFKRLLFTKSRLRVWLPQLIAVLSFLSLLTFVLIKEGIIGTIFFLLTSGNKNIVTGILFAILLFWGMTAIFYIVIVGTNLSGQFTFRKISYLPISPFSFYFSELSASFADIWSLILLIFLSALVIGINSAFSFWALLGNAAFIFLFILLMGVLGRFLIYFLNFLFNFSQNSRLKNIFSVLLFFLLFFIVALPMVLINKNLSQSSQQLSEFFYNSHLIFSPFGAVAEGFLHLNFHDGLVSVLESFILLISYLIVFFAAGYFFFIKSLSETSVESEKKAARSRRLMLTDNLLSPLFKEKAIFIAKEFTYLLRSPRMIVFCIIGVLLMVYYLSSSTILRHGSNNLMLLIWLIYPALILLLDSTYVFSYDEKAMASYFFAPISFKDILFSKNISVFLFVFSFQIILAVGAFVFWHPAIAPVSLLSTILISGYVIFSYLVVINKIVIQNPPDLKFNSIFGRSNTNIGLSFGWLIAILAPAIGFFILFHKSTILLLTSYAFLFLLAISFYFISLPKFSEKLAENQEYFIKKISG